ncbi:DUF3848 domain-containing protein [Acetatifactor muris]|uniref:Uncharacterized protein n=1 Tax=Acetatifactor muris TaxID=879566 RepID=A0A2K4ZKC9_9FIRM|nr:DUF3848 domain-containing protein [Acetatifactor muris]MCR2049160.1 DUF3848 domain-containing protein [Acetatifactor muris]MCX4306512.1 DUF3848 domain-containing protein [Acetatifactor sp.]SOY30921.1 hypothetical protein AMURIS_03655 [Acetatifactor muris]
MDENELRDLLSKRLYIELQLFKDSMLRKEKGDIFQSSYEIEIYVNLYEIFMMHIGSLDIDTMRRLLNLKLGIMEHLYQEWLSRDDSFFDELREFACDELGVLSGLWNLDCGEEEADGKRSDKAA